MTEPSDLAGDLQTLSRKWEHLTAIPEPPQTTLQVIEYSLDRQRKAEEYVNRALRYYLDPEKPHGLDDEFLRAFLEVLPEACEFDHDVHDLSSVVVEDQVRTFGPRGNWPAVEDDEVGKLHEGANTAAIEAWIESNRPNGAVAEDTYGIVDLVVEAPGEWFLLVELKFSAGENNLDGQGPSQTEHYFRAWQIGEVARTDYESGEHFLFVHPAREPSANEANFGNLTWGEIDEGVLESLLAEHAARFPSRTVAQLRELRADLQHLARMSERNNQDDGKVELFLEHYEAITDVSKTFEKRWERFTGEWPAMLARSLGEREGVQARVDALPVDVHEGLDEDERDQYAAVTVAGEGTAAGDWIFRGTHRDWAPLFKHGWWRSATGHTPIYTRRSGRSEARISYIHRLDWHRDRALGDGELVIHLRNAGANDQSFIDRFHGEFEARRRRIESALPPAMRWTGQKNDVLEGSYEIRIDEHESIFEAYVDALERAVVANVLERTALVELIDEAYMAAFEGVYR